MFKGRRNPISISVDEENYFDVADGLWWFCMDWHSGGSSALYRVGSTLGFKPGPSVRGPEGETAQQVYDELEQMAELNYRSAEDEVERLAEEINAVYALRHNPSSGLKWVVRRDGVVKHVAATENAALVWLQRAVPYSWHHAMKYEGWTVNLEKPPRGKRNPRTRRNPVGPGVDHFIIRSGRTGQRMGRQYESLREATKAAKGYAEIEMFVNIVAVSPNGFEYPATEKTVWGKQMKSSSCTRTRRNPGVSAADMKHIKAIKGFKPWMLQHPDFMKGLRKYREFHGCWPTKISCKDLPGMTRKDDPAFLVGMGKAMDTTYKPTDKRSSKYGSAYIHEFADNKKKPKESDLPDRACTPDGKTIVTYGGKFAVKDWVRG